MGSSILPHKQEFISMVKILTTVWESNQEYRGTRISSSIPFLFYSWHPVGNMEEKVYLIIYTWAYV